MIGLLALAGCSGGRKKPDEAVNGTDDKEVGPERRIHSENVAIEQKDETGKVVWIARAETSLTKTRENGTTEVEMSGVTGEILQNGKIVSRFESKQGVARDADKSIQLSQAVKVTSIEQKLVLNADQISWREAEKLYDARGNVIIVGEDFTMGPEARLIASGDLKKIGTPDRFKK